tara:strand:+ start:5754 stop:6674 length:921 start_codon:yes stop_codon:yes gene_type:complete
MKHFTDIKDLSNLDLKKIIAFTQKQKQLIKSKKVNEINKILTNKNIGLFFEKPSTRTRVSFEVSINQLGGNCVQLKPEELQISRGETISDTAKVLSRYLDGIIIRCFSHSLLIEFSQYSTIPIINGLTNTSHPCQIIADLFTIQEYFGDKKRTKIAWLGDTNNVTKSWVDLAKISNIEFTISSPKELLNSNLYIKEALKTHKNIKFEENPIKAVKSANVLTTDTWVSMGDKSVDKHNLLKPYQINKNLIKSASKEAVFMHCLPASRGKEVTSEVIDGKQSIVFDQAENRLHVQRSIINWCFEDDFK